ncbi:MAG: GNAT family N-acetyltransferase [Firmicutes bacterium]|nr:GNAT family N-acetyltransferase [Bacillota bacterium]
MKKDEKEKKICTLFVSDEYRKQGLGSLLFEELNNTPIITIVPLLNYMNELKYLIHNNSGR